MSFINVFTLSNIQYVAVKLKINSVRSYQTACIENRFLSGAYRDYICIDCEAYTNDENGRFPVLIT